MRARKDLGFGIGAGVLVLAALILGYQQLGGRAGQRDLMADAARVRDLRAIAEAIHQDWMRNAQLPAKLADVEPAFGAVELRITDPVTSTPYRYVPKANSKYELCATFAAASRDEEPPEISRYWAHTKGRYCFALDAAVAVAY